MSQTALVTFKNSITMGNSRYDCAGIPSFEPDPLPGLMVSLGHNIRGGTCPVLLDGTDLSSIDPMLMPMPAPRSFPPTLVLAPGSPAIDAGDDGACPATDARGVPRPQDGDGDSVAHCDIGAYELEP